MINNYRTALISFLTTTVAIVAALLFCGTIFLILWSLGTLIFIDEPVMCKGLVPTAEQQLADGTTRAHGAMWVEAPCDAFKESFY